MAQTAAQKTVMKIEVPPAHNWRTTDVDEINRRRLRAQTEPLEVRPQDRRHPIFSTFKVSSGSGGVYSVEIRSLSRQSFACTCVDFRINGLGTCKHIEAALLYLEARYRRLFREAKKRESPFLDIIPDPTRDTLRIENSANGLARQWRRFFTADGQLKGEPEEALDALGKALIPNLRISHPRKLPPGCKRDGIYRSAGHCSTNMSRKSSPANGRRKKRVSPFIRTSEKGCSISPSKSALFWPMKWGWERLSRLWLPAPFCADWGRPHGSWW